MPETDLTRDHAEIYDTLVARRYFAKFARITQHLARVAASMEAERRLSRADVKIIGAYVEALARTFHALSIKYLMTGRLDGPLSGRLTFDRVDSGFPIAAELMTMANDAQQAPRHLANMPTPAAIKDDMVRQIVGDLTIPTRLQFALSQRLYYEALAAGGLFWARNDPVALWQDNLHDQRQHFLLHWAVYDSTENLPVLYLMDVEDSGRTALPKDQARWPEAQAHLMAQSLAGLKLVTIAQGFDADFDDLHPKRLRRITLGPMHSHDFTLQSGPIQAVLAAANAPDGDDWALAWTVEELLSERVEWVKSGWFGQVERQIWAKDPGDGQWAESGATSTQRSLILPQRPYQVLAEQNPPGLRDVRKFVVSAGGRVLSNR